MYFSSLAQIGTLPNSGFASPGEAMNSFCLPQSSAVVIPSEAALRPTRNLLFVCADGRAVCVSGFGSPMDTSPRQPRKRLDLSDYPAKPALEDGQSESEESVRQSGDSSPPRSLRSPFPRRAAARAAHKHRDVSWAHVPRSGSLREPRRVPSELSRFPARGCRWGSS